MKAHGEHKIYDEMRKQYDDMFFNGMTSKSKKKDKVPEKLSPVRRRMKNKNKNR